MTHGTALRRASSLAALTLASCASAQQVSSPFAARLPSALVPLVPAAPFTLRQATGKIQHVVIIVQENRSFDNLFQGFPGADTVPSGLNNRNQAIELQPIGLERDYTIDHSHNSMFEACNAIGLIPGTDCRMNGFNLEASQGGPQNPEYVYVPHAESAPYFALAKEFVLADRMFQSHLDESFVSHQYIIAAQAAHAIDIPSGDWGCGGGHTNSIQTITSRLERGPSESPCFDYQTIADELDTAGYTWRFYTSPIDTSDGVWSGYQAVKHIRYGPDWTKDIVTPQVQFFHDVAAGHLANVTWITPTCANSDHPNCGGKTGPYWVANLANAVGDSKFWDSTAIFVMWDDWGGFYDHVRPPYEDYDGLGFRVPMIVVSAYAKAGYVSHVQYEHGSILKFVEDTFGLGRLAASDTRANSPAADCFQFGKRPRRYQPIPTPYGVDFFISQPIDRRPPDDD